MEVLLILLKSIEKAIYLFAFTKVIKELWKICFGFWHQKNKTTAKMFQEKLNFTLGIMQCNVSIDFYDIFFYMQ